MESSLHLPRRDGRLLSKNLLTVRVARRDVQGRSAARVFTTRSRLKKKKDQFRNFKRVEDGGGGGGGGGGSFRVRRK